MSVLTCYVTNQCSKTWYNFKKPLGSENIIIVLVDGAVCSFYNEVEVSLDTLETDL